MTRTNTNKIKLALYGTCFACGVVATGGVLLTAAPLTTTLLACGATAYLGGKTGKSYYKGLSPKAKAGMKSKFKFLGAGTYGAVALGSGIAAAVTFGTPACVVFGGVAVAGAIMSYGNTLIAKSLHNKSK